MPTIKDVAALSRVSTATVSHVINNSSNVSPHLRDRVLNAIRDLKYHPNAIARGLKTSKTKTVGMIVPDITNPFYPAVIRGAEDVLRDAGYILTVGNSDSDPAKEELYYRTFRAQRVDGLILTACLSTHPPEYILHHELGTIPVVFVDRYYSGLGVDIAIVDNVRGSFSAVTHLLNAGHRRIAILTGPMELINARMRLRGYKKALAQAGVSLQREWIFAGRFDADSGYDATRRMLDLPQRPTAVFSSNAQMTLGCLRALRESGLSWCHDIAVVSFDDAPLFELMEPSITAVAQNSYELGAQAAILLLGRLDESFRGPPRRKLLRPELIVRESSNSRS